MSSELEKFVAHPPAPIAAALPPPESPKVTHISSSCHNDCRLNPSSLLLPLYTPPWLVLSIL